MLLSLWNSLKPLPFGKHIFSKFLGWKVPYTGTIRPLVLEMSSGHVEIRMKDRRRVRNHLNSIHAIALANLGEVTSGLTVVSALPEHARAILVHFEIDYLKKARGTLIGSANFKLDDPEVREKKTYEVEAHIKDQNLDIVAKVKARWLIGPKS